MSVYGRASYSNATFGTPKPAYRRKWFIRDSSTAPLIEMLSFYEAELTARSRSKINNTGIVETVVEELDSGSQFVAAIFRRGRKLQQGQRARTSSKLGLPPSI